MAITETQSQIRALVKKLYKDALGNPLRLTRGQLEIFEAIYTRKNPRVHCMTTTQYGKSLDAGLAVLTVCSTFPERFAIIAGKKDKAQIIMDYVIGHIFDNAYTRSRFVIEDGESEESIRRQRNKKRLNFVVDKEKGLMGEVFIGSAKDALGFGAQNVIVDEAAFVSDTELALVMRMLGAAGQGRNFLMKIGNPFERNHFLKSYRDPAYHKIVITHEQAVKEGRLTQEFVEEMRNQAFFGILYDCQFPEAAAIDKRGYSPLLTEDMLDRAYVDAMDIFGDKRLGFDVAGGGKNFSTITLRGENAAKLLWKSDTQDTMLVATKVAEYAKAFGVTPDDKHIFGDNVGIGRGACDRLNEMFAMNPDGSTNQFGVNVGMAPEESETYDHADKVNLRAQAYWRTAEWIGRGGKLVGKATFDDLLDIRFKSQSDKKIKIKTKDEMREDGIESPDCADSLMLTFTKSKAKFAKTFKQKGEWEVADGT